MYGISNKRRLRFINMRQKQSVLSQSNLDPSLSKVRSSSLESLLDYAENNSNIDEDMKEYKNFEVSQFVGGSQSKNLRL